MLAHRRVQDVKACGGLEREKFAVSMDYGVQWYSDSSSCLDLARLSWSLLAKKLNIQG
jgi:hypothetical protein